MAISKLSIYVVDLMAWGGESRYSPQQVLDAPLENVIVRLDTDDGLTGWGECCVAPPFYLPTLSAGAIEAIKYVAPLVIRADEGSPRKTMEAIRFSLRGHEPSKAAIDMALWDLTGKRHGLPLVDLWGGRLVEDLPVLAMVSIGTPDETVERMQAYREQGYSIFQIKIGLGSASEDIEKITRVMAELRGDERCWFDQQRGRRRLR